MHLSRSRFVSVVVPFLIFVFSKGVFAATINAASCSSANVQTAINAASSGDVVVLPGGACTWSSTVTIPNTKGITLNGGGATITGLLVLNANSNASTRITNFIFESNGAVTTNGTKGVSAPFRIDNCTFDNHDTMLVLTGNAPGLIDHNTFYNVTANNEMIHNMGEGPGCTGCWTDSVTPGSAINMIFLETNTFTFDAGKSPLNPSPPYYFWGTSAVQSYYGARTVFRDNVLTMVQVDQHGTCGNINARWWEIYDNTFHVIASANQSSYMRLRGGSGVIFDNHAPDQANNSGAGSIEMAQDCTSGTYPLPGQVGRGISQASSPAYVWGNDSTMSVAASNPTYVLAGRDFFTSSTQPANIPRQEMSTDNSSTTYNYSPFTYPYPLDSNGLPSPSGGSTPPTSSVAITSPTAGATVSGTTMTISATASSSTGVAGVQFKLDGTNLGAQDTVSPYSLVWDTTQAVNGSHSLTAVLVDGVGNQTTSAAVGVTVSNVTAVDTQAPTTPNGLTAAVASSSQINLSWTPSTDNVGVAGYKIFRGGTEVGTSATTTYSDSGLSASTVYIYTLSAFDAAGNNSSQSNTASATTSGASQPQGFIPSSRTVDWTQAGIPGGIPSANWPIYTTLSPSGGSDDSVAIQAALNAAPVGSVVLLAPGTFTLHRSSTVCSGFSDDFASGVREAGLCISKKVVLRGSGPDETILNYGDGANIISLGTTYLSTGNTVFKTITAGASKGSTQITVQSSAGIAAGSYLTITQNNPLDSDGNPLVNVTGYTGSCSGCGHGFSNNVMTQIDKVTNISGNVLTLETPLYFDYTNSPQFYLLPGMVEGAGLENLRLQPTASSGTGIVYKNINLESCAYCWVHNVESDMAVDRANVYLSDVYASEISNNYLNDAYSHASGEGYGVMIEFRGSGNLIQNNIIRKARHSTVLAGGSGNVWGYNYLIDPYMSDGPNVLPEGRTHGAHPYMNLWESNIASSIEFDFTHGSSSHNTLFRNYYNLTSTNPTTGNPMTNGINGVNIAYFNNYLNVVGNVIGEYGATCTANIYEQNADAAQSSTIYNLGYYDDGGTTSPNSVLSNKVGQTLVRGGNWDCRTNSTVWSSNVPSGSLTVGYLGQQELPTSLYLSAKPNWFTGSGVVWPAIDPSASTKANKIPAQVCYEAGPKSGAAFNPTMCYAATGPQPPTNVSATVK